MSRPEVRAAYIDSYRSAPSTSARAASQDFALFTKDWDFRLEDITARVDVWHGDARSKCPDLSWIPQAARIPGARMHVLPRSRTPGRSRPPRRDSADSELSEPPVARSEPMPVPLHGVSSSRLLGREPDANSSANSRPRGPGAVVSRCASPPDCGRPSRGSSPTIWDWFHQPVRARHTPTCAQLLCRHHQMSPGHWHCDGWWPETRLQGVPNICRSASRVRTGGQPGP